MTAKKSSTAEQRDIAEVRAYDAKVELDRAETERKRIEIARERIMYEEEKKMDSFQNTLDFRVGYFVFDASITGEIVEQWSDHLRRFSKMQPTKPITIELNSPGGELFSGLALYDTILELRDKGHYVTIKVRGMAASFAMVLLQAGDLRLAGRNAWLMFHSAAFGAEGHSFEVEDQLVVAKRLESQMINILSGRSHKSQAYFTSLFKKRKDVYFDAEEALEAGFIDAIG